MNTYMWDSIFTEMHISILEEQLGVRIIPPVSKALACGDVGTGAMAAPLEIAQAVKSAVILRQDLRTSNACMQQRRKVQK